MPDQNIPQKGSLPFLPLRGIVVFPRSLLQIYVGRKSSIQSIKRALHADTLILLNAQLQAETDQPEQQDLYEIGTLARVIRVTNLPDGNAKVVLEGLERHKLIALTYHNEEGYTGEYSIIQSKSSDTATLSSLYALLLARVNEYIQHRQQPSEETLKALKDSAEQPSKLIDIVLGLMPFGLDDKYKLLEIDDDGERIETLIALVESYTELLRVDEKIQNRIRKQVSKTHREHYLQEQMKAIQQEITDMDQNKDPLNALEASIDKKKMSIEAKEKAKEDLERLRLMPTMSAEATVIRNYLDTLLALPWNKKTKMNTDIVKAKQQLDEDHYSLEDVKERILEYLAATKRAKKLKAPVLCLVGPPGVGKTSLGKSIATATHRKFVRLSLGGVRDESEIRGHRKTYIGSMPGRIIQKMTKSGTSNPLFLLDEIDKMGQDFRGDPASALLEVLDPEQNNSFNDHYLEVDYDLSEVMFICTSNSMNIPEALLDRLEIIRLSGYTENEKLHIAQNHLLPKQFHQHNVEKDLLINSSSLQKIIRQYTREAGVRELERKISKIVRRFIFRLEAKEISTKQLPWTVTEDQLTDLLGPEKFNTSEIDHTGEIGIVNGLAWTKYGGEILKVETLLAKGQGKFVMTGSLGDVMQESVKAAMSLVKSKSVWLNVPDDFFSSNDIHIHMPEGATPKDGPSAGIAMCTALFSMISGIPVRSRIAMTGEVTISGKVLPIGGLKEKVLAAQRSGITRVLIPTQNEKDLIEFPEGVLDEIECIFVDNIDQVLQLALEHFDSSWIMNKPTLPQETSSPRHTH